MTTKISFSSYLGWVNVADPANIPADVRIISADDLLRYEKFGDAAKQAINELIDTTADHETRISQNKTAVDNHTQTLTNQGQTLTSHGQTLADHTQSLTDLNTKVGPLVATSGAKVSASKAYDLTVAGGAKTIATVTGGSSYTSFEVEVTLIGRTTSGDLYARVLRYIRPENGNPQYDTIGTDTLLGGIGISFATSGTAGVTVLASVTGVDALVTAHVNVRAGAGAATGAARTATLAMA